MNTRVTGDNYRDYKKYLEIQKMNNGSSNNYVPNKTNTNSNMLNGNSIMNQQFNSSNNNSNFTNNNSLNATTNSNSRVPFVYTPMNRPPTGDISHNNTPNINLNSTSNNNYQNNRPISQMSNINPNLKNLYQDNEFNSYNNNLSANNNNMGNNNNNNNNNNDYILQEINNLKIMFSRNVQNQSEMQNKIIEYNKIINEQENIIRLNNLKLDEHDNKLTEILLSFNNYLQLNEKTSSVVGDMQKKIENCVNNNDLLDLKTTMYNLNKSNEDKINEINNIYESMNNKLSEMGKENETYQKFTLEKIKAIQKDSMDTRLQQQNELIKMEDSKENRINAQFTQLKNLISLNDNNLKEESEFRKNMITDLRNEMLEIFSKKDEQLCKLEKTQLETEKNLISLNKDYITSFNDLINKNNEKYNFELKSIRSLVEGGLTKVDLKMEKDLKIYEENLTILKSNILEQKTNLSNLDTFLKESINEIENKLEITKGTNSDYFTKFDLLSTSFKEFMEESMKIINTKTKETEDKLTKLIEETFNKLENRLDLSNEKYDKHFIDVDEKLKETAEQMLSLLQNGFSGKKEGEDIPGVVGNGNNFFIREYVKKICDENILPLKEMISGFETNILNNMKTKIEESKNKFSLDQIDNVKKLQDMFDKRVEELKEKITKNIEDERHINDGKIQEYVVESELRITNKYDEEIKTIKDDLETLTLKIGIGA